MEWVDVGREVLGSADWMKVVLLGFLIVLGLAYNAERRKNERHNSERLRQAREDTELLVETVNEAVNTVREFRSSHDALRVAIESLVVLVKDCHQMLGRKEGAR